MSNVAGKPCILCVAITGSLPTKENNPAVPITIAEQVESTQEAFEAGATIAHCHVRDDEGKPTSDPERFARLKEGLEQHCPAPDWSRWRRTSARPPSTPPPVPSCFGAVLRPNRSRLGRRSRLVPMPRGRWWG